MKDGQETTKLSGAPQGAAISTLLSNIDLHVLDTMWEDPYAHRLRGTIRYPERAF